MNLLPYHRGYRAAVQEQEACIESFKSRIAAFGKKDCSSILTIFHPSWVQTRLHQHPYFEFLYLYQGTLTTVLDGEILHLTEGDLCLMNLKAKHRILKGDNTRDVAFNILVLPNVFNNFFLRMNNSSSFVSSFFNEAFQYQMKSQNYLLFHRDKQDCIFETIVQLMIACDNTPQPLQAEMLVSLFSALLAELTNQYQKHVSFGKPGQRSGRDIYEIIQYIGEHLTDISLSALADHFNYAPSYLSRIIKQYSGKNFSEIILDIRLSQAAKLLIESNRSIQEIMFSVGCTNSTWFINKFKKKFHCLPHDYRNQPEQRHHSILY